MSKIFALSHFWYEEYSIIHFLGPDDVSKEQFQKLCYSLVDLAAFAAISKEIKYKYPCPIGWKDVVEAMVPLLEKQGYHRLQCDQISFSGGLINKSKPAHQNEEDYRLSKEAFTAILNFNKKLSAK